VRASRIEALSDGVIAILVTIMVLEPPKPHGGTWEALGRDLPVLLASVLSFVHLGISWHDHHHRFQVMSASAAACCGRTCTCCSGCRSCRS